MEKLQVLLCLSMTPKEPPAIHVRHDGIHTLKLTPPEADRLQDELQRALAVLREGPIPG